MRWVSALKSVLRGRAISDAIDADEEVVFFPTYAALEDACWRVPIHGWIYEPEETTRLRKLALRGINRMLGWKLTRADMRMPLFRQRMGAFLVDNERNHIVRVQMGGKSFALNKSRGDGHFTGVLKIPTGELDDLLKGVDAKPGGARRLSFEAILPDADTREFGGQVELIPPAGVSVISDIDDTIKITEVLDRKLFMHNTFLNAYKPVPGMGELYARWAKLGVSFHYVTASPWQLYVFFSEFLKAEGFPEGSWHMKHFRPVGRGMHRLFRSARDVKIRPVKQIVQDFPKRRFVLVGDSGQHDAAIYGQIARQWPERILKIAIRDVTGHPADAPRYAEAFAGVPREKWQLFRKPDDIDVPLRAALTAR